MRLTLTQFVSLDGVSQGPGAPDEDPSGGFTRGGWFVPFLDRVFLDRAASWLEQADGLVLGRRTYTAFARDWPRITDPADPFTHLMNTLPKYVATTRGVTTDWGPVTVLGEDAAAAVAELKQRPGRELQIHGSSVLARSLMSAGLLDELRLVVAPVVVGQGRRLFADGAPALGFRPVHSETTPAGLDIRHFERAETPAAATYAGVSAVG
ncbi:dihydrofolate reductase family protein [Georgenia sp. H159]|uniref:dihydrofolate reductase family protein n=1 Tax=Georgenia sp. H159 TaxID=3076115 RepID=UPI002D797ABC|nr:dihydrofolate reductase family protein [Georgenia sp. H159]